MLLEYEVPSIFTRLRGRNILSFPSCPIGSWVKIALVELRLPVVVRDSPRSSAKQVSCGLAPNIWLSDRAWIGQG